ncbi:hypothetical protein DPMN_034310 [Dreissena polymorpha]|uniref:Uncharacterized protein n=1 Tax=Dreissena polymorpha TaxID=45954 RepID=A0A9D4M7N1_DREPO|nr:hypothetical protein DPMN_034310 [Dreissena polymorpha]
MKLLLINKGFGESNTLSRICCATSLIVLASTAELNQICLGNVLLFSTGSGNFSCILNGTGDNNPIV